MSNLKVEGMARDWCPKCKHCTGCNHIGTYTCEDPYDGLLREMHSDDDILCSMFEPKSDISHISRLEHELEMDKLRKKIHQLEKEKAAHMKGIERLKKSQEKLQNQIKNLQITNEESYKREEELKDKYEKLNTHYRYDEDIIKDIQDVISPGDNSIWSHSEIVNEIKNLKVQSDENGTMYNDLKYWKERCHKAETDVTTLNSKVEVLDKRNSNQSVMIGEKGKEIERLAKKNRELQIRVNDLLFQEKLNKSAFGYDYEEENDKLRVENEQLRNENKCLRNRYPTYSVMKAENKIEHIQKEAKKWKRKYKEAYDILQEFFGEHSNIMSVSYDLSGDQLTLKLLYDDSAYTKHNRLEKARERMRKLD